MNKILTFDLDNERECLRFAQLVAALNASGATYEVAKDRNDNVATVEIGTGY